MKRSWTLTYLQLQSKWWKGSMHTYLNWNVSLCVAGLFFWSFIYFFLFLFNFLCLHHCSLKSVISCSTPPHSVKFFINGVNLVLILSCLTQNNCSRVGSICIYLEFAPSRKCYWIYPLSVQRIDVQLDVRDMSIFPDDSFGSVIDKGKFIFYHMWSMIHLEV